MSYIIDYFEKYSKFSVAFLSGIIFSTINSFPEFITSFIGSFDGKNHEAVFGNLMGGNLFIIFSLSIVTFIFIKNFKKNKIIFSNVLMWSLLLLTYVFGSYGIFAPDSWQIKFNGSFNLMSLLIIITYVGMFIYTTFFIKKEDKNLNQVILPKWLKNINMKTAVIAFSGFSLSIIGISIGLSFVTEELIAEWFGNSKGFGSSLLLGIPTSLPELISIIWLFKIKNYNAAIESVFGSALFSVFSFSLCDAFTSHIPDFSIYDFNFKNFDNIFQSEKFILILFTIISIITLGFIVFINKTNFKTKFSIGVFCGFNILIYVGYIIIGFTLIKYDVSSLIYFEIIDQNIFFIEDSVPLLKRHHYLNNNFFLH